MGSALSRRMGEESTLAEGAQLTSEAVCLGKWAGEEKERGVCACVYECVGLLRSMLGLGVPLSRQLCVSVEMRL